MVGAVLVHDNRIIGEGWHRQYGQRHAEINAFEGVRETDRPLVPHSTLYVSLEPCCIFGRTPPCTDRIIAEQIKKLVISVRDRTAEVSGRGVQRLRDAGVEVIENVCPHEGSELAEVRNTFVREDRPFVFLKYAVSRDGKMGGDRRIQLSNELSKRLVHRWRVQCDAILVGTRTALTDNPSLTVRYGPGRSPLRVVPDRRGVLPADLQLFDGGVPTLIFTEQPDREDRTGASFVQSDLSERRTENLLRELHRRGVTSLMVEGGAELLRSFYRTGLWDRALVLQTPVQLGEGIDAPLPPGAPAATRTLLDNELFIYKNSR